MYEIATGDVVQISQYEILISRNKFDSMIVNETIQITSTITIAIKVKYGFFKLNYVILTLPYAEDNSIAPVYNL